MSFGVWGPHLGPVDGDGRAVLGELAGAGYDGSELGPTGYLGDPERTAELFVAAGLAPAGVYVGLPTVEGMLSRDARTDLERACRTLRAVVDAQLSVGPGGALPDAPIVLADDGAPGLDGPRDPADESSGLDAEQWRGAVRALGEAMGIVADHGLTTSFHPHLGTFVESEREVDRLLATTSLSVTLDTGHALLAGTDPVAAVTRWGARINHVHVKDVRLDVLAQARAAGPVALRSWWGEANVPLGAGDVDLSGVLRALDRRGYAGWYVVEQDVVPTGAPQLAEFGAAQRDNLDTLLGVLP
ncbi:TIM barrel protein [Kineococcus gynurae]|uniref:TIM barrel protein n=1 Tax=Kineococcus gynurae TaxID=452979 RepID=A0ABV5LN68_9ACTN